MSSSFTGIPSPGASTGPCSRPHDAYLPGGFNGDILGVLRPIHRGVLQFVGFDVLAPQIVFGPVRLSDEERKEQLDAYRRRLTGIEPEQPMVVGEY